MFKITGNETLDRKIIEERKIDHIGICIAKNVDSNYNYWDDINFINNSLPEINKQDIFTETEFFGKGLQYPLFIAAMSGGHLRSRTLNETFAKVASELRIGFCTGSMRAGIENPNSMDTYTIVKEYDIPLCMATIGGSQLVRQKNRQPFTVEQIIEAADAINAHALTIFLNFPQEMIQPEGDENAHGILGAIRDLTKNFEINVKECSFGISGEVATLLKKAGVKSIEVSGVSGTSWTAVEHYRAKKAGVENKAAMGKTFWNWGIPSPISVLWCRKSVGDIKIIGSGGIRTGLDIARTIALGADAASVAKSILLPALKGHDQLIDRFNCIIDELKTAMFLTGSQNIEELKGAKCIITGKTAEWKRELML